MAALLYSHSQADALNADYRSCVSLGGSKSSILPKTFQAARKEKAIAAILVKTDKTVVWHVSQEVS